MEAIGAISDSDLTKASSKAGGYQETVREKVDRQFDDDAVLFEDEDIDEDMSGGFVFSGIQKVPRLH